MSRKRLPRSTFSHHDVTRLARFAVLLAALLLSSCAGAGATTNPTATAQPTAAVRAPTATTSQPDPSSAPTALLPTPVPATTAPQPAAEPTSAATPEAGQPLDVQAQAAALLPQFASDLGRAGEWNRYTISAAIDPQARAIAGHVRLEYTNRDSAALDRLYFHLYPNLPDFAGSLEIGQISVDGEPVPVVYEAKRFLLRVDLPRPLAPSANSAIQIDFTASAPVNAAKDYYGAFNMDPGILSLASAYPTVAIVRAGSWDLTRPDPKGDFVNSETALYDVTLEAPADWQLVTTGVAVDSRLDAGKQVARFVSGPQRDFMIVATQFHHASANVDGTRVTSYFRPEHAAGGQTALQAGADALRAFNKRYGPYPLAELDIVEVNSGTFLGVEYPGLIEIQQDLYAGTDGLEITVAHEVGHQWWYSQVGNNALNESWLDEALASYSQIVYQEEVHGAQAAAGELDGFRRRYRSALSAGRDAPVEQPNSAFHGNYVSLVYGKAVLFFQALRKQIGEQAFDRFLREHYARHRYGFVTGADLLADAEDACACQLDDLYQNWIVKAVPVDIP